MSRPRMYAVNPAHVGKINKRYDGRDRQSRRRYPRILRLYWLRSSHSCLQAVVAELQREIEAAPEKRKHTVKCADKDITLRGVVKFTPATGFCDDEGNEIDSFKASSGDARYAADMVLQIMIGVAVRKGLVPEFGRLPFPLYFGQDCPSWSCTVTYEYGGKIGFSPEVGRPYAIMTTLTSIARVCVSKRRGEYQYEFRFTHRIEELKSWGAGRGHRMTQVVMVAPAKLPASWKPAV